MPRKNCALTQGPQIGDDVHDLLVAERRVAAFGRHVYTCGVGRVPDRAACLDEVEQFLVDGGISGAYVTPL